MEQEIKELTEFDTLVCDSKLQMMKAAIPFIPIKEQRILSVYVKYMELKNTIKLVNSLSPDSLGICSVKNANNEDGNSLLLTIRKYCTDKEREMLDTISTMINAYQMFKTYKDIFEDFTPAPDDGDNTNESKADAGSLLNMLKEMLSPEQQEMLSAFSSVIDT